MSFGTELASIALAQLQEFGRSVTYVRIVNGDYVPATSSFTQVATPITISALIEEEKDEGKDSGLAAVASKKMTVAAGSFGGDPPTLVDIVTMDGSTFAVNDIDTFTVGNEIVLYIFNLRKG